LAFFAISPFPLINTGSEKLNSSNVNAQAVEIADLVKTFGPFTAVDHISLAVNRGEIFGFLGPNGAGKSTTIRMLCGILTPTSGQGKVAGFDIFTQAEKIKQNIGYMSQKFSLYEDLTVEENLNFYSGIYTIPPPLIPERKEWALKMAGLQEKRLTITRNLAGGGNSVSPWVRDPPRTVDPFSRRTHLGRRPSLPPPVLGPDLRTGRERRQHFCDDSLYG